MPRRHPLTPVFDPGRRRGQIAHGAMIGAPRPILALRGSITSSTFLDFAYGMGKLGDHLFVCATSDLRVTVLDVSDPDNPTIVTHLADATALAAPYNIAIDPTNEVAYVVNGIPRVAALDISNPAAPTVISSLVLPFDPAESGSGPNDIVLDGTMVYIASAAQNTVWVVDVTNPAAMTVSGSTTNAEEATLNIPQGIVKVGDYCYAMCIGGATDSVVTIDVSVPSTPTVVSALTDASLNCLGASLDAIGSRLYVASFTNDSIRPVSLTTPATPALVGTPLIDVGLDGCAEPVIDGSRLYAAALTANSVSAVDLTDPDSPVLLETLTDATLSGARRILKDGAYLYVACTGVDTVTIVQIVS